MSLEFGYRVGGRDIVDTGGVQLIISIQLNTDQSNNAVCPSLILLSRRSDVAKNICRTAVYNDGQRFFSHNDRWPSLVSALCHLAFADSTLCDFLFFSVFAYLLSFSFLSFF